MALLQLTKEFNRREHDHGINFYAVHPGIINSGLWREYSFNPVRLAPYILKTASEGASTTIYCATSSFCENESGYYYSDCDKATVRCDANWKKKQLEVWNVCENYCNSDF